MKEARADYDPDVERVRMAQSRLLPRVKMLTK